MSAGTPTESARLLRLATWASTLTAFLLMFIKGAAWFSTGSLIVMASMVDSLMDAAASLINLMAVRYSLKSPDQDHQFGHGKAESLAGLGQACFIAGSAIFLLMQAGERFNHPQTMDRVDVGFGVMIFALAATLMLFTLQKYVISRTGSAAIRADALHYQSDLLSNTAAIVAFFFAASGWPLVDPLGAIAIACYILYSAWVIAKDALHVLMDHELPEDVRQKIREITLSHPGVLGIHNLRTRQSGQSIVVQFHLDLNRDSPLAEAHQITKWVENAILSAFPAAQLIIHQDPRDPERTIEQRVNGHGEARIAR